MYREERKKTYTTLLRTCVFVKCPKAQAEVKQYRSKVRSA